MSSATLERPKARKNDPITSLRAAESVNGRTASRMINLLAAYAKAGKDGLTAEEAAMTLGLNAIDGYWKRVSDLYGLGYITVVPDVAATKKANNRYWYTNITVPATRMTTSGRQARVFKITKRGRSFLSEYRKSLKKSSSK